MWRGYVMASREYDMFTRTSSLIGVVYLHQDPEVLEHTSTDCHRTAVNLHVLK